MATWTASYCFLSIHLTQKPAVTEKYSNLAIQALSFPTWVKSVIPLRHKQIVYNGDMTQLNNHGGVPPSSFRQRSVAKRANVVCWWACLLGPPARCPSLPFCWGAFCWGGFPDYNRLHKKGYPYFNLSTGGPSLCKP